MSGHFGSFSGAHYGTPHYAGSYYRGFTAAHSFAAAHGTVAGYGAAHGAIHAVRPGTVRPGTVSPGTPGYPGTTGHPGTPYAPGTTYWHGGHAWVGGYYHGVYWPHVWFYPGFAWYVPVLPWGYATYWWGGMPYYYSNSLYYTWSPTDNGYVVTDPPPADGGGSADAGVAPYDQYTPPPAPNYDQSAPPPQSYDQSAPPPQSYGQSAPPSQYAAPAGAGAQLYLYPRNGQSDAQTQNDRYECHSWAVNQTGYDPTRSSQGDPTEYRRAMIACLDARGYTAR